MCVFFTIKILKLSWFSKKAFIPQYFREVTNTTMNIDIKIIFFIVFAMIYFGGYIQVIHKSVST